MHRQFFFQPISTGGPEFPVTTFEPGADEPSQDIWQPSTIAGVAIGALTTVVLLPAIVLVGVCMVYHGHKRTDEEQSGQQNPSSPQDRPTDHHWDNPIYDTPPDASSSGTVLRGSPRLEYCASPTPSTVADGEQGFDDSFESGEEDSQPEAPETTRCPAEPIYENPEVLARKLADKKEQKRLREATQQGDNEAIQQMLAGLPLSYRQRLLSARDGHRKTAFDHALRKGHRDTAELLQSYANEEASVTTVPPVKPPRTGAARPVSEAIYTEPDLQTQSGDAVMPEDRHDLIPAEYKTPVNNPASLSESTSAVTSATVEAYSIVSLVPQASVTPPEPPVMHTEILPGEDSLDPTYKAEDTGEEVTEEYARPDPRHVSQKRARREREEQLRLAAAAGNDALTTSTVLTEELEPPSIPEVGDATNRPPMILSTQNR